MSQVKGALMPNWTVESPGSLDLGPQQIRKVSIRIVRGNVDVVAGTGPARLEVTQLAGPPLEVSVENGKLTVAHEHLRWGGILSWVTGGDRNSRAILSLTVPPESEVELGVVSADATVSGITGRTKVRGVSGEVTIDGCSADVEAESVSGNLETRGLDGKLNFKTVSGDLTVVDGSAGLVAAKTVSGHVTLDLAEVAGPLQLASVSGDITVRVPQDAALDVEARSTSGKVGSSFEALVSSRTPGVNRLDGRVGTGGAKFSARTVSGDITLLARDPA
jgi:hypothetical protein